MKLFSTFNFVIPIIVMIVNNPKRNKTLLPWCFAKYARPPVKWDCASLLKESSFFFKSNNIDGNKIKEVRKVTLNPIAIIQPKSITGFMPLNTRDVKAQIVVNAVYKQGHTIFFVVKNTISLCSLFGISLQSCLYRTAKWMFIAIVKINIKEIKLDDMTVTSQFTNPRTPIIIRTA